jgi:membrane protein
VLLLLLAVGTIVRFAPARPRPTRWVSFGSLLIITAWIVAALIFKWYVSSVASFTSAWGTLTAFLVLTAFLYTSSIIFLVGVQLDELLRLDARGKTGPLHILRHPPH